MPIKPRGIDFGNVEAVKKGKQKEVKLAPLRDQTALRRSNTTLRKMTDEKVKGAPKTKVVATAGRRKVDPMKRPPGPRAYIRAHNRAANTRERKLGIRKADDLKMSPWGFAYGPV